MPLLNYSTTVDAIKTVFEIEAILAKHGVRESRKLYDDDGMVCALEFTVNTPKGEIPIRLPIDHDSVLQVLEKQRVEPRYRTKDQALKIAWRILKDWVAAQMAIIETEMVSMDEVFLPYIITKTGNTLYWEIYSRGYLLNEGGK